MSAVDHLVSAVAALVAQSRDGEELKPAVNRAVYALVGRAGLTDEGFAPAENVADVLREARARLVDLPEEQSAIKFMVLAELERMLAMVGRSRP